MENQKLSFNFHSQMALSFIAKYKESRNLSTPMDPELSQHPLLLHGDDEMIGFLVEAVKIMITSPPELSFVKAIQEIFREYLFQTVFSDNKLQELITLGALEVSEKTICGKRLNQPGIYIRCLDCEIRHEVQSSLCPDCFENSNHEGHRICIVNMTGGVAATCDCGDVTVFSAKGSCPNHQAQEIDLEKLLQKMPTMFVEKFQNIMKKAFYCVISVFEMSERAKKEVNIKKCLWTFADLLLNELINFMKMCSNQCKEFFTAVIGIMLQDKLSEVFDRVWHNCEDFLADEDSQNVDVTQNHACRCSVFGNICRIGNIMGKTTQTKLSDFMLECLIVQNIKENIGVEFMKYMSYLLCQNFSIDYPPEITLTLFSEILNMSGHIFMRESMMKKLIENNCIDIVIQIIQKVIDKSTRSGQITNISIAYSIKIINTIFELQYPCTQTLVKEQTYQKKIFEILAQFHKKFYIESKIDINTFSHQIDFIALLCGTDTEAELNDTLGYFISTFCRFPQEEKLYFAKSFMTQWYSEFILAQENHIKKRSNSYVSIFPSFQRILCDFMMHYLNNSISPEDIKAVFKATLPDVQMDKFFGDAIVQTIQSFGLIRYVFIILSSFGNQIWPLERDLKYHIFEKDVLSTQLFVRQIEPNLLWRVFTENFFLYDNELSEFFKNPEILNTEDGRYKRKVACLKDFLTFIIYLMNNGISFINLKLRNKQIFFDEIEALNIQEKKQIEKLIINAFISFNNKEIGQIKNLLEKNFLKDNEEIERIILKISILDEKTHKLKLKEEYEEQYDPYIFYKIPQFQDAAESYLHDKSHQKMDLVSGVFEPDLPLYLKEIQQRFYQSDLPNFLSLFISKINKASSVVIQPVLKLILQNLQLVNEGDISSVNEEVLKKTIENYMRNEFINSLERIKNESELVFYKPCVGKILTLLKLLSKRLNIQGLEFTENEELNQTSINIEEEEKKKLAKERIEKKKAEFAKKQALFVDKNKEIMQEDSKEMAPEVLSKQETLVCQHCLEVIDEEKDDYGIPGIIIMTNNFYDTEKPVSCKSINLIKDEWWIVVSSCWHSYHRKCFIKEYETKSEQGETLISFRTKSNCTLCKTFCNTFVSQSRQPKHDSIDFLQEIKDCINTGLNFISIVNANTPANITTEQIFTKTFKYFIESFHLHSQPKTLKEIFNLYVLFFRSFSSYFKEKQALKINEESSLLTQINNEVFKQENKENLQEFQPEPMLNENFIKILTQNFTENSSSNEEAITKQFMSLLKDYIEFKIIQLFPLNKNNTPSTLEEYFAAFDQEESKNTIINEFIFPIQKLTLAANLIKSINTRDFHVNPRLYQLLCESDPSPSYLSELLKESGFTFSFEDLIQEIKAEIPKHLASDNEVFEALMKPISIEAELTKPKIVKLAPKYISLPKTYKEFLAKYSKRKCEYCNTLGQTGRVCICLLCGESFCFNFCNTSSKNPIGNLTTHSLKHHMGLGYFLMKISLERIIISLQRNEVHADTNVYIDNFGQSIQRLVDNQKDVHLADFKSFYLAPEFERHLKNVVNNHSMAEECFRIKPVGQTNYDLLF